MSGPGSSDEIQGGRIRVQTRARHQEAAAGLIGAIGPCDKGRISQAPLVAHDAGDEMTKLPDYIVKEAEPGLTSHCAVCS